MSIPLEKSAGLDSPRPVRDRSSLTGFTIQELIQAVGAVAVRSGSTAAFSGISTDSRTIAPGEAFIAIKGDNFDGHEFIAEAVKRGAGCVIRKRSRGEYPAISQTVLGRVSSGGAPPAILEVEDTIKAYGDIARFHRRRFSAPVIAVTGSNGKTTTKEMISWLLSEKYSVLKNPGTKNNHIGLPAALLDLDENHDIIVLEIGTNHFGEVEYLARICEPNIGIITNIGQSHLEYLGNEQGVYREKSALIRELHSPGIALLNADDIFLKEEVFRNNARPFVIGFGITARVDLYSSRIARSPGMVSFRLNGKYGVSLKTAGRHNIYNALAALAAGSLFGMRFEDMSRRLSGFEFPAGRLKIRLIGGVNFIDDTYNSNPFSFRHALRALEDMACKGRKIVVMGDMLELGEFEKKFHREAGKSAAGVCDVLITVGSLSRFAAGEARACGFHAGGIFTCTSSAEARDILFNKIKVMKNDLVLVKGSRRLKLEQIFETREEHSV
ncbi:MAG: UDP-N-acetylmuramoyl-tripeptide--D-alanyl-D-alanine ligase [Candidatus Omnitrophota bacterium]|jgi:UDP-N-acetylmuramoyl-tripeptide--D-alanyl-D-alanine ligase